MHKGENIQTITWQSAWEKLIYFQYEIETFCYVWTFIKCTLIYKGNEYGIQNWLYPCKKSIISVFVYIVVAKLALGGYMGEQIKIDTLALGSCMGERAKINTLLLALVSRRGERVKIDTLVTW